MVGVYYDIYGVDNSRCLPTNAGNEGSILASSRGSLIEACADADGIGLASNTRVPYINIIIARGEATAGKNAHGDVVHAGGVVIKRTGTNGRVVAALGVTPERCR